MLVYLVCDDGENSIDGKKKCLQLWPFSFEHRTQSKFHLSSNIIHVIWHNFIYFFFICFSKSQFYWYSIIILLFLVNKILCRLKIEQRFLKIITSNIVYIQWGVIVIYTYKDMFHP